MEDQESTMEFDVILELYDEEYDVTVTVPVTDDELDAMADDYCEDSYLDLEDNSDTQELYERIKAAALAEADLEDSEDLEININAPEDVVTLAENGPEWENYSDYPFAMEVVNGQIISLTEEMGNIMFQRLLEKLNVTKEELAEYMLARFRDYNDDYDDWSNESEDEEDEDWDDDTADNDDRETIEDQILEQVTAQLADERFALLADYEYEALESLLSFCYEDPSVGAPCFGFLECDYGFEAANLLTELGFDLQERTNHGAHGHDTAGVQFIRHIQ